MLEDMQGMKKVESKDIGDNSTSVKENIPSDAPMFDYDLLAMYMNWDDYHLTDKITIHQPTIGEIVKYGDVDFYRMVSTFCANPTSMRLELWDSGIDWNDISDFELFIMLSQGFEQKDTEIIFGDLDFQKFKVESKSEDSDDLVMIYLPDIDIQIDELIYLRMVDYLRFMFNIHPKVEHAKGKVTKEFIIDEERMNRAYEKRKSQESQNSGSVLLRLISSAVNHASFKYKKDELKDVGIVEFMDSIKRLGLYERTISLMHGINSGFVDTSKMDLGKALDWTRDLYSKD